MGRVRVTQILDKNSGELITDIDADDDDDCDKERRVLEAMQLLFGVEATDVRDEHAGPRQVEAVRKKVKN